MNRDLPKEAAFIDSLLLRSLRTGRVAPLLRNLMVVYQADIAQNVDGRPIWFEPTAICETIEMLERRVPSDLTKGPHQYDVGPLRGLWRKHFVQSDHLLQNVLNEMKLKGRGFDNIRRAFIERYGTFPLPDKPLDDDDIELISRALVKSALDRRASEGRMTGEHLVYARTREYNLYLYASYHGEPELAIAAAVRECVQDYPEIADAAPDLYRSR